MPKGPKGQKRPADVISNAVHVMRIATGEIQEATKDGKNAAAVALALRSRSEMFAAGVCHDVLRFPIP